MSVTLGDALLLVDVKHAAQARAHSEDVWRDCILTAHAAGLSYRAIAGAAGVSHQRVAQIVAAHAGEQTDAL